MLKLTWKSMGKTDFFIYFFSASIFFPFLLVKSCKSFSLSLNMLKYFIIYYTYFQKMIFFNFLKGRQLFKQVLSAKSLFHWLHTYPQVWLYPHNNHNNFKYVFDVVWTNKNCYICLNYGWITLILRLRICSSNQK